MKSRLVVAAVLACLSLLTWTSVALGHAELVESDPPADGTIETTPYTLTATFDEPLEPNSSIVVRNVDADEVASGGVDETADTVLVAELPELPPGSYRANWTATTADGHTERGRINFTVAEPPAASPAATPTEAPTAEPTDETPPTPTAAPTPSPAQPSPSPAASPPPDGGTTTGTGDLLIALTLAGIAIAAVVAFLFLRGRR